MIIISSTEIKLNSNTIEKFEEFLKEFIIKKNFFLYKNEKYNTPINNPKDSINHIIEKLRKVDKSDDDFKTKISKQLADYTHSSDEKNIFRHIIWLWALPCTDIKSWKKGLNVFDGDSDFKVEDKFAKVDGIASGGQYYLTNKFFEVFYLLKLIENLWKNDINDIASVKDKIKELCLDDKTFSDEEIVEGKTFHVKNLLLHLCSPNDYPPITSNSHRKSIVKCFEFLSKNEKDEYAQCTFILKKLKEKKLDVWQPPLSYIWRESSESTFSEENALKFKKAIILYGHPGTSKTYSADKIAKALIFQDETSKKELKRIIEETTKEETTKKAIYNIWKDKIHRLQLHANYTYEDFIWGYQIEKDTSKPKKGYLLKLIDKINESEEKIPHILILDELNRVDLSRLFGELFSAIENRDQEIELPVEVEGTKKIKIPENLYFIGTMNEIDFSLEQVDFALRRRFVWFFKGFDKNLLQKILNDKIANTNIEENELEDYIKKCKEVNNSIKNNPDLGDRYEIGHTFFAEVIDIFNSLDNKKLEKASEVLWNISIKPMIQAYLGNLDKDTQKNTIKTIEGQFLAKNENKKNNIDGR